MIIWPSGSRTKVVVVCLVPGQFGQEQRAVAQLERPARENVIVVIARAASGTIAAR